MATKNDEQAARMAEFWAAICLQCNGAGRVRTCDTVLAPKCRACGGTGKAPKENAA